MKRTSRLSTLEEIALEERREGIRNSRCRRYLSVIVGIGLTLNLSGLGNSHAIAAWIRTILGG